MSRRRNILYIIMPVRIVQRRLNNTPENIAEIIRELCGDLAGFLRVLIGQYNDLSIPSLNNSCEYNIHNVYIGRIKRVQLKRY